MTKLPKPCNDSKSVWYTKRNQRRIIKKDTEECMERVKKSIEKYFAAKKCSIKTNEIYSLFYTQTQQDEHVTYTEDRQFLNDIQNEVPYVLSSYTNDQQNHDPHEIIQQNHEWDHDVDENFILKDFEFEYRYSDFEDSDCNNTEDSDCAVKITPLNMTNIPIPESSTSKISDMDILSSQLKRLLPDWAVDNNINQTAFTDLLHRIRSDAPSLKLPLDCRTLKQTPQHTIIHEICDGEYCHFGLDSCLEKIIMDRRLKNIKETNIELLINVDGAPVGDSTAKTLWPILCSDKLGKNVYIIGIFSGRSKPTDPDQFLTFFVEEAKNYVNNGITVQKTHYSVTIDGLICDAPAKAYILGVKCHSGYFSCTKCEIKGELRKCVCFPGGISILRTDDKFDMFAYTHDEKKKSYQLKKSILTQIPKLGLVTQVPLDPMHLVFLGVVRKIFLILIFAPLSCKLPYIVKSRMTNDMINLAKYIPYDFARKPRGLDDIKFFKATEWRQILLYTGIVFLKDYVSKDVYDNFVTLHVAIRILSNSTMCQYSTWIDYAEILMTIFVQKFQKLYGRRYVSHNVHSLLHLADDVRRYGELDNFSAFRFEDFIGRIKRLLRSGHRPLQQLSRRFIEIENVKNKVLTSCDEIFPSFKQQHEKGPLTSNFVNVLQYKVGQFRSFKVNCDDVKNSYVYVDCEFIVKVLNFVICNNETYLIGRKLDMLGPFFKYPCCSSKLGINIVVENKNNTITAWNVDLITSKVLILPYKSKIVAIPILHTVVRNVNSDKNCT